jgi:2-polyprenyl-6-methoxyphenol hydroxylase-like FAD-dependent oxidoreductase
MHPVTAHGFNCGLLGLESLSQAIIQAKEEGMDIGSRVLLERYEKQHRRNTRPLFLITRLITEIYTRESPPAKLLRKAMLHIGQRLRPLKHSIAASLSGA